MSERSSNVSARTISPFGLCLKRWREGRRESQLSLALSADVSQRHLSFVESGRASPSREMVMRLCGALDLPLRARNELLLAAGFAPHYAERSLAIEPMGPVRAALDRILDHHEPFPAFVLDRAWAVVASNRSGLSLVRACVDETTLAKVSEGGALNFMQLMFEPDKMRRRIRNWERIAPRLLARLRREAAGDPSSPALRLLETLGSAAGLPALEPDAVPLEPILSLELEVGETVLKLFNTITTFGTPQDVTVQDLRIDMSFPADEATDAWLRRNADVCGRVEGR
jgi:transcriptional regulator with XRE-family HTH domain